MNIFVYQNGQNLTNYINALKSVNLTAVVSDNLNLASKCSALLLTGGDNLHPYFYGNISHPLSSVDLQTDLAEYCLIRLFLKQNKGIFGVCKGMQTLNVFFGGTLKFITSHNLCLHTVTENGLGQVLVNSYHEQAIDELGFNLKITHLSPDGVIEGIKHEKHKVLGVQFHPERMNLEYFKSLIYSVLF